MYIILGTILIIIIAYFWETIYKMVTSFAANANNIEYSGNIWFVSLLFINLLLVAFIVSFYYIKSHTKGPQGETGEKGLPGPTAEGCKFDDGCQLANHDED